MFNTLIVQPIFNLLVFIYAIIPGHNFGLAIVLFTIVIRFLMWPLVRKQLRHAKAMRELAPEIKKIKAATKGNRQQESLLVMELYKEREINPFASIGIIIVQIPILIGLYSSIRKIIDDPNVLHTFSYSWVHNLSWLKQLQAGTVHFDASLFGFVDLTRTAVGKTGAIYWPAFIIVFLSAVSQFFQSKQLMPVDKDARSLRQILKEAGKGKKAEQGDVNAAVGRSTRYLLPVMIFLFTLNIASALALYWFVSGFVAYLQQAYILKKEENELETKKPAKARRINKKEPIEAEIVSSKKQTKTQKPKKRATKKRKR